MIINNLQVNSFKNELKKHLEDWKNKNYPFIFIKRFASIIIGITTSYFCNNYSEQIDDISNLADELLCKCFSYEEIYNSILDFFEKEMTDFQSLYNRKNSSEELLNNIIEYMKANIYGNINMLNISERFNVSASYINRLMKMRYNTTPMDYYIRLKIEEAKRLIIEDKNIMIKDISDSLCFSDQHYFSKVFKAYVGVSPSEYKNNVHNLQQN